MKVDIWSGAALISIALAGSISTQEMPLAPDIVRKREGIEVELFFGMS